MNISVKSTSTVLINLDGKEIELSLEDAQKLAKELGAALAIFDLPKNNLRDLEKKIKKINDIPDTRPWPTVPNPYGPYKTSPTWPYGPQIYCSNEPESILAGPLNIWMEAVNSLNNEYKK